MDTSEAYIKMWLSSGLKINPDEYQPWACPKCNKIIPTKDIELFDGLAMYCEKCRLKSKKLDHFVVLMPVARQDQLWEILLNVSMGKDDNKVDFTYHFFASKDITTKIIFFKFCKFHHIHKDTTNDFCFVSNKPEQALIQGVMYELHNKRWTGKAWG